jgi:hypothetical protein
MSLEYVVKEYKSGEKFDQHANELGKVGWRVHSWRIRVERAPAPMTFLQEVWIVLYERERTPPGQG